MKHCSSLCSKLTGVIRILLGLGMLYMGLMKFGPDAAMIDMVGGAGPKAGLTFFSNETWYRIATVGELLAGLFLISGCVKLTKIGALLTVVIMLFALNALGRTTPMTVLAWIFLVAALVILIKGTGDWCFCPCKACKEGGCDTDRGSCCGGVCSSKDMMKDGIDTMKQGAATIGAGAVAGATEMMEEVKETVDDVADSAKEVIDITKEKVEDMVEQAEEVLEEKTS